MNASEDINILKLYLSELNRDVKIDMDLDVIPIFKQIFKLEKKFSSTLRSFKEGRDVYHGFCKYILEEVADLREARSFFRERLSSYLPKVNKAISRSNMKELYRIHINYSFCVFAMKRLSSLKVQGKNFDKLNTIMNEMKFLRNSIINHHLYLALSQAKIYSSKSKNGTLEFSDFIQCANEALVISVDKYVIDENAVKFHKMALGRIISHLITLQAAHFSSATLGTHGQKKLYSLRKILNEMNGNVKIPEIAQILKIAEQDISDLINSIKYMSTDMPVSNDSDGLLSEFMDLQDEGTLDADEVLIKKQLENKMKDFYKTLTLIEQKILTLKGVLPYGEYKNNNS